MLFKEEELKKQREGTIQYRENLKNEIKLLTDEYDKVKIGNVATKDEIEKL